MMLAVGCQAAQAQSISITPAYGGSRISTPWGDFVAIPEGSTGMWIGTVGQYMDRKADSTAASAGMRRAQIDGQGDGIRTYVGGGPGTKVGATRIYDVATVLFPEGRDMLVTWTASNTAEVRQILAVAGRTYRPSSCEVDSCTYALSDAALTAPMTIVFYRQGVTPGAITIPSAARQQFEQLQAARKRGDVGEEDESLLRRLHSLDGSIPAGMP